MPETSRTDVPRTVAGRYRLDEPIARGASAEVWRATDLTLGRKVAVKILRSHLAADRSAIERFRVEAVSAARLVHPNVVETYDAGIDGHVAYIVMELVGGRSLRAVLAEEGSFPPGRAVRVATQVTAALEEAHGQGIVHRDVKPANIMLLAEDRVKVADFGITNAVDGAMTPPGGTTRPVTSGTRRDGDGFGRADDADPAEIEADLRGVGAVLYEMLCGQPPFDDHAPAGPGLAPPPLAPRQIKAGIPKPLEAATLRALSEGLGRFSSAGELQSALLSIDFGRDDAVPMVLREETPPEGTPAIKFRQTERAWLWPTALILIVAVTLGIVGVLFATTDTGQRFFNREPDAPADSAQTAAVALRPFALFDPEGDGDEHNAELPLLGDGDPQTAWSTHQYQGSQPFGGLKAGVGLIVTTERAVDVKELVITTPSQGWTVAVYVADRPQTTLAGWGAPVTTSSGVSRSTVTLPLGRQASAVLVWISDPGPANQVEISEIELKRA